MIDLAEAPNVAPLEECLIGLVIRCNDAWYSADVEPDHFFDPLNAKFWQLITDRISAGDSVSQMTGRNYLPADEARIFALMVESVFGADNAMEVAEGYAKEIRLAYARRRMMELSSTMYEHAKNPDGSNLDALIARFMEEMSRLDAAPSIVTAGQLMGEIIAELKEPVQVTPTGIDGLDRVMMGGLLPRRLYGIGGRYKAGKSFFLSTISYNMALAGVPHGYITLESSARELTERMVSRALNANVMMFLDAESRKKPRWQERVSAIEDEVARWPLHMQTAPRMNASALRMAVAQMVKQHGVKGVIVDYLQLVAAGSEDNRVTHYENVAQTLAELARLYGIWIVVAAQVNSEGGIRWGEGLLNACDMALILSRIETEMDDDVHAWVEMRASRYTPMANFGSDGAPSLILDRSSGPHFRSL